MYFRMGNSTDGVFFLFTGAATVYPSHASGAVVALVDENTGSDAELAAEAFRRLNLGVVVGTRTWGGLLTTSDSFKLVDGSEVSMPQQAVAMTDLTDSGVKIANRIENRGVVPDVQVCNAPHDYANDRDPQLEAAVAEALRLLDAHKSPKFEAGTGGRRRGSGGERGTGARGPGRVQVAVQDVRAVP